MRRSPATLFAAAAAAAIALAGCSSSSSSSTPAAPMTGTETLTATAAGSQAAANLNNPNNNAPIDFPEATWTGPVATTLKPFALGGNSNKGDVHWATPAGTVTVYHASAPGYANPNAPPPGVAWTKNGTDCTFAVTFDKGTFTYVPSQSTGEFARLSGSGSYAVHAQGTAPLTSGKTTCSFPNIGNVTDSGAKIDFTATAPVTLKPAS